MKSKKNHGELRIINRSKYDKTIKTIQRRGRGGWKDVGWIDCKAEQLDSLDYNHYSVEDLQIIISYIILNRENWRRFAYTSANALGLSVKSGMSVTDTKGLPVESLCSSKTNKEEDKDE